MHIPKGPTAGLELALFEPALQAALQPSPDYDAARWLYVPNTYSEYRYILGTRGKKPLICVGINPSTAAPDALDPTLQSAQRIALANGYDSFLMFNVYAQRATRPDDMEHALNPALTERLPADAALCLYAGLREEYAAPDGTRCLATRDVRLARRLVRDCLFRGHGAAFTLGLWGHVCAGEDRYIKPYKPRANLLLDTTHTYEVCLWRTVLDAMPADPALTATQARQLAALREKFAAFPALGTELVPQNSMLREFIGK